MTPTPKLTIGWNGCNFYWLDIDRAMLEEEALECWEQPGSVKWSPRARAEMERRSGKNLPPDAPAPTADPKGEP